MKRFPNKLSAAVIWACHCGYVHFSNRYVHTLLPSFIHATLTDRWCLLFQHDLPTIDASERNIFHLLNALGFAPFSLTITVRLGDHCHPPYPSNPSMAVLHMLCVFNNDVKAKGFSKINLKPVPPRNIYLRDDKCFHRLNVCVSSVLCI